jgi:hypothetical protein
MARRMHHHALLLVFSAHGTILSLGLTSLIMILILKTFRASQDTMDLGRLLLGT